MGGGIFYERGTPVVLACSLVHNLDLPRPLAHSYSFLVQHKPRDGASKAPITGLQKPPVSWEARISKPLTPETPDSPRFASWVRDEVYRVTSLIRKHIPPRTPMGP
jgi:hypothetical protein